MINSNTFAKLINDKGLFWLCIFIYVVFNVFYPTQSLIISDEYSYLSLSQEILGSNDYSYLPRFHDYVLVYPTMLGLFTFVVGLDNSWIFGPICLLTSILVLHKSLGESKNRYDSLLLFFFFFPVLLFSRTLMSELPSMLCVSVIVALIGKRDQNILSITGLVFISILSYGIREANSVLMAPLLLYCVVKNRQYIGQIVLVGALSILILLLMNQHFYGSMFYMRNPGVSFGLANIGENMLLLLYCTFLLIPLGLWYVLRPNTEIHRIMAISVLGYLALHLLYQFNGYSHSGIKSFVTYPRFIIPTLPLFIYIFSVCKVHKNVFYVIRLLVLPITVTTLILSFLVSSIYSQISNNIGEYVKDSPLYVFDERNELFKISNPYSPLKVFIITDENLLMEQPYYFLDISRYDTDLMKGATETIINSDFKRLQSWNSEFIETSYTLYYINNK